MKRSLIILLFLSIISNLTAQQKSSEIKVDIFHPINAQLEAFHVSYEWFLTDHIGFEMDVLFENKTSVFDSSSFTNPSFSFLNYDTDHLSFLLETKFYPSEKTPGNRGFFIGAYTTFIFHLNESEIYREAFRQKFGKYPSNQKGLERLGLGMLGGYKFLFKEKFVIEPSITFDLNLLDLADSRFSLDGRLFLKLGYRL